MSGTYEWMLAPWVLSLPMCTPFEAGAALSDNPLPIMAHLACDR
jgi:hypothetical protein